MPNNNKHELRASIMALLKPLSTNPALQDPLDAPLNDESELARDLGLNSLQVMELIESIEDHFDISVPLNLLPQIKTVADLVQQLERILAHEPV